MKKVPHHKPSDASLIVLALFIVAGIAQCGREDRGHHPTDACGSAGSHPVTIGGSMVIGCQ